MKFAPQFVPHLSVHSTKIRSKLPIHYKAVWAHFLRYSGAPRSRRARASVAQYPRKYGDLPIREILVITSPYARPSAPRAYQRKKTQWTGMAIGKANATRDYFGGKSLSHPTGNPGSVIVPQYRYSKITVFVWGKNTILKFLGNTK